MQINWFTVIAQTINFVILVWLLKRFLYKPVLKAIDEREKKIAGQLQDAEAKKAAAEMEQNGFRQKNDDFDRQKKLQMDQAVADSNTERQKLLAEAKDQADALRANLEKATIEDRDNQNRQIALKTQQQVFEITRKTLAAIASISLEEQSVNSFIRRLNESKDEEKKQFKEAFQSNSNTILVRSAFDLPEKQQGEINGAVDEVLGIKTRMEFKTAPELIGGIELATNGYKLGWSFSAYLNSLENSISGKMKEETENK